MIGAGGDDDEIEVGVEAADLAHDRWLRFVAEEQLAAAERKLAEQRAARVRGGVSTAGGWRGLSPEEGLALNAAIAAVWEKGVSRQGADKAVGEELKALGIEGPRVDAILTGKRIRRVRLKLA